MPFLGSALGWTAMCSLGWGNLVAFDWNDLPVGREFDCKFLKKAKSPPHALPLPPPTGITLIGALTDKEDAVRGFTTVTEKEIQSRNKARIPQNTERSTTCLHGVQEFRMTG